MTDSSTPLIVHVLHRLDLAGAEVLAAGLARRLQGGAGRFRFAFFCLDGLGPLGEKLAEEGYAVEVLGRRPGIDPGLAVRLRRKLRAYRADVVHAHQYTPWFYAAAARGPGLARPKILFTEHGRHYPDRRNLKRVVFNRVMLRRGDRVTAVGRFIRHALHDNEGIPRRRVQVIYNGVPIPGESDAVSPMTAAGTGSVRPENAEQRRRFREQARVELGLGAAEPVVMQVARFHPVKDHLTGLQAFCKAVHRVPDARLVLVGDGTQRSAIEAEISRLHLDGRVVLTGVRHDVPALLPAADVFLLSSLSEGISVTLLEAMAQRLPICATQVGGNPEVVEHARNGLLSPRADPMAMSVNLVTLLEDPALRERMGEAGHLRLIERFSQRAMHERYAAVYEEMTASRRV